MVRGQGLRIRGNAIFSVRYPTSPRENQESHIIYSYVDDYVRVLGDERGLREEKKGWAWRRVFPTRLVLLARVHTEAGVVPW